MRLNPDQLATLMETGMVAVRDEAHAIQGEAASLDMLGLALRRLDASASRHRFPRCPECGDDLHHSDLSTELCAECAARRHELQA